MRSHDHTVTHRAAPVLAVTLWMLASAPTASAAVLVDASVVDGGGGVFDWSFVVTNTGLVDVSIVTLTDAPVGDPWIEPSLSAPAGFVAFYDPGLGFVDFVEDTQPFPVGPPIGGFAFSSLSGPASGAFRTFEALDVLGGLIEGDVTITPVVAPEPGVLPLLALGWLAARVRSGRRRSPH